MPAGTVYRRQSDGRWCASLQINGRRRTIYGKTEAEAKRKLARLQGQATLAGGLPEPGCRAVGDLLAAWLEAARPTLKPKTLADYEHVCRRYILPGIGKVRLSKLEPSHLQGLYASLQARKLARVPAQVHAVVHRACKLGVLWRWLADNPADRVLRPGYHAPRKDVWSAEQVRRFLADTREHRFGPLWATLVYSGCRLGELLALRWEDVDTDGGAIAIRRTLARINRQWVETTPKTRAGERAIALPTDAVAALRRQKAQQAAWRLQTGQGWQDEGRVFPNLAGGPLQPCEVEHALPRVCAMLGLPRVTPHGLRHLSASLALAAGVPLPDVSKRLGHANVAITGAIYSHALPGRDRQVADALERAVAVGR